MLNSNRSLFRFLRDLGTTGERQLLALVQFEFNQTEPVPNR